jgi:hypothetical protein
LGVPLGAPVLPGLSSRGAYRMEGVRPRQRLARNPLSMRVREPRRSLQCGFCWVKVNGKTAISTIFFGFYAIFFVFCLFLPVFFGFDEPFQPSS